MSNTAERKRLSPDQLATQLHDCFMRVPRKQLGALLSTLLNSCPESVLEETHAQAVKLGVMPEIRSRFQSDFSHNLMDLTFGFLDLKSLRAAETTCGRWRNSCVDHLSGWMTYLCNPEDHCNHEWVHELKRHKIDPARLVKMTKARAASLMPEAVYAAMAKLPNVHTLSIPIYADETMQVLGSLETVRTLTGRKHWQGFRAREPLSRTFVALLQRPLGTLAQNIMIEAHRVEAEDAAVLAKLPSLTSLVIAAEFASPAQPFETLRRLAVATIAPDFKLLAPRLAVLQVREECELPRLLPTLLQPFSLRSLELKRARLGTAAELAQLSSLTSLTELSLCETNWRPAADFAFLSSLTKLVDLRLGAVDFTQQQPPDLFRPLVDLDALQMHANGRVDISRLGLSARLRSLILADRIVSGTEAKDLYPEPSEPQQLSDEDMTVIANQFKQLKLLTMWQLAEAHLKILWRNPAPGRVVSGYVCTWRPFRKPS